MSVLTTEILNEIHRMTFNSLDELRLSWQMLLDNLPDRGLNPVVSEELPLPGECPVHVSQPGGRGGHVCDVQDQVGGEMLGEIHPDLMSNLSDEHVKYCTHNSSSILTSFPKAGYTMTVSHFLFMASSLSTDSL